MKKQIVLISALALMLTACGGSSSDSSETEANESGAVTTQESGSEAGPGQAEAKQACEYWAIAQEQTIDTIGDYLLAASESANEAAAISSEWDQLVTDLDTIYPLATDPDSGSPTDLLATSSSLDATCESYESWEGAVSARLPKGNGSSTQEEESKLEPEPEPEPELANYVGLNAAYDFLEDVEELVPRKWKLSSDGDVTEYENVRFDNKGKYTPSACANAAALFYGHTDLTDPGTQTFRVFKRESASTAVEVLVSIIQVNEDTNPLAVLSECNRLKQEETIGETSGGVRLGRSYTWKWTSDRRQEGSDSVNVVGTEKYKVNDGSTNGAQWSDVTYVYHLNGENLLMLELRSVTKVENYQGGTQSKTYRQPKTLTQDSFFDESGAFISAFDTMVAENQS